MKSRGQERVRTGEGEEEERKNTGNEEKGEGNKENAKREAKQREVKNETSNAGERITGATEQKEKRQEIKIEEVMKEERKDDINAANLNK
eukprot:g33905.t1